MLWAKLTKHDAPRMLGDVFQAFVAAVFLDSEDLSDLVDLMSCLLYTSDAADE